MTHWRTSRTVAGCQPSGSRIAPYSTRRNSIPIPSQSILIDRPLPLRKLREASFDIFALGVWFLLALINAVAVLGSVFILVFFATHS